LYLFRKSHLQKQAATNGLTLFFEDNTQAHSKLIGVNVGRALSGVTTFMRRTVCLELTSL
jgi:hypothetical protein